MNTDTRSAWDIPLYARKPRRNIPGTDYVAVTMYRSDDGTVRTIALFSKDGMVSLGTIHYQPRRRFLTAGYTLNPVRRISDESWPNLTAAVQALAARLGVVS